MQFAHNVVRHGLRAGLRCAPVVGSPTPRLGRNTGAYIYGRRTALSSGPFSGRNDKKRLHHSHRCSLEKPCGLNPVGGFTISRRCERLSIFILTERPFVVKNNFSELVFGVRPSTICCVFPIFNRPRNVGKGATGAGLRPDGSLAIRGEDPPSPKGRKAIFGPCGLNCRWRDIRRPQSASFLPTAVGVLPGRTFAPGGRGGHHRAQPDQCHPLGVALGRSCVPSPGPHRKATRWTARWAVRAESRPAHNVAGIGADRAARAATMRRIGDKGAPPKPAEPGTNPRALSEGWSVAGFRWGNVAGRDGVRGHRRGPSDAHCAERFMARWRFFNGRAYRSRSVLGATATTPEQSGGGRPGIGVRLTGRIVAGSRHRYRPMPTDRRALLRTPRPPLLLRRSSSCR